jgi:glycosyltransferase involved in cell wall biosynthesis
MQPHQDGELIWEIEQNIAEPFIVGKGGVLYLSGWCYHRHRRIKQLSVLVDDVSHPILNHSMGDASVLASQAPHLDPIGNSLTSRFWTALSFDEIADSLQVDLRLKSVLDNGEICVADIGQLFLLPVTREATQAFPPQESTSSDEPLIAICLTTYNPPADLFASQIESLIKQTHQNWACIICDDCSTESCWEEIQKIVAQDARFYFHRNAERLGFYRNFERCLKHVPATAKFIALADQDDYWYPNKLAESLAAFQPEITMVYSDMEIVTREGELISPTLWTARENNYKDLAALLFTNTVTGAAIVFRASLLAEILPFPDLPGDSYHDHWIACVALTKGELGYIHQPLYAWRQHESNACGISATQPKRIRAWFELALIVYLLFLFLRLATDFRAYMMPVRQYYFLYLVRTTVLAKTLRLRVKNASARKTAQLEWIERFESSLPALFVAACEYTFSRRVTLGRELMCLRVALCFRLFNAYCRWMRRLFYRRCLKTSDMRSELP